MSDKLFELINKGVEQPELVTLRSGFLILPGTDISNLISEELIVLVHPFHPKAYINDKKNPKYENKRDQLVRSCKSPILMGFEDVRLPVSTRWLQGLQPQGPRIIYQTGYVNPIPIQPSEKDFVERVKATFNTSKIRLGGAELYLQEDGEPAKRGCVNDTYRFLSPHFAVILDRRYCWKGQQ
ncbi:MAG: hypothetical protein Q7J54_07030 [Candidatus Woesearchaeota archaeon]|nr:hypothetical protein [Candidatus Woesearchaeota archaeon]